MKRVQISVTADDIAIGIQGDYTSCPIANAIWRTIADAKRVWCGHSTGHYDTNEGEVVCFSMPVEAELFVSAFDRNGAEAVKPFTFELQIDQ